ELAPGIIASANQGEHVACMGIHRNERNLRLRAGFNLSLILRRLTFSDLGALSAALSNLLVHQLDPSFHSLGCSALQFWIERCVNAICLLIHFTFRELADQRVAN